MSYLTAALLFAVVVATQGQGHRPPPPSFYQFGAGKMINFAAPSMDMQKICRMINMAYSPGQLSDAMGAAMKWFDHKGILGGMAAKQGSGMQCMYNWARSPGSGEAGNLFGDIYDSIIESPHQNGFFWKDPCADPAFCQCGQMMGMTPPQAMKEMTKFGNNMVMPMTPLGVCVKKTLCKNNPLDWRCGATASKHINAMSVWLDPLTSMGRTLFTGTAPGFGAGMGAGMGANTRGGFNTGAAAANPFAAAFKNMFNPRPAAHTQPAAAANPMAAAFKQMTAAMSPAANNYANTGYGNMNTQQYSQANQAGYGNTNTQQYSQANQAGYGNTNPQQYSQTNQSSYWYTNPQQYSQTNQAGNGNMNTQYSQTNQASYGNTNPQQYSQTNQASYGNTNTQQYWDTTATQAQTPVVQTQQTQQTYQTQVTQGNSQTDKLMAEIQKNPLLAKFAGDPAFTKTLSSIISQHLGGGQTQQTQQTQQVAAQPAYNQFQQAASQPQYQQQNTWQQQQTWQQKPQNQFQQFTQQFTPPQMQMPQMWQYLMG